MADLQRAAVRPACPPLFIEEASPEEWDAFESGYLADWEEWLVDHPGHPDAERVRERADEHREQWLRGYRDRQGFAYMTLGAA